MKNEAVTLETRMGDFKVLNEMSKKGGVVFFGGNYFSRMNINELADGNEMAEKIYDRSIENLQLSDAFKILEDGIYSLNPAKIFVNIGDCDCCDENFNEAEFISKYEWLLLSLHRNCRKSKIYIVSVISDFHSARTLNEKLSCLAQETGCVFINVTREARESLGFERVFNTLKPYMRIFPVKFAQAMQMA
ncbi:MAG: hypothetical protein J6K96_06380 [Treponema sp.]|nr:hypothetical protein [Treponema sp.]